MFRFLNRLQRDEGGASLLYAALVMLLLVVFSLTVLDVGQVVHRKVQAQTTADAAAYSTAANFAKAMNLLTFMNLVIVATYGAIAMTWVVTVAACVGTLGLGCPLFIRLAVTLSKLMYRFAKLVNKGQDIFVTVVGPLIALETYRIAYRNMTDGKEFEWSWDFSAILEGTGNVFQHGALPVSGAPKVPPMLSDAVRQGDVRTLLHLVPKNKSKQPSASGTVTQTIPYTKRCTLEVETTICAPDWIYDNEICHDCIRYGNVNRRDPRVSRGSWHSAGDVDCITDNVQYVVTKETTKIVEQDLDPENPGPPMPYFLRPTWENALRFCTFAFRFEGKKVASEKFFNKDKMLPLNVTVAEAETYDPDRVGDNNLILMDPDWEARLRPVSVHERALEELPRKWRKKLAAGIGAFLVH